MADKTIREASRGELTVTDYGVCMDCGTYFDLWRYDDIESTGHAGHRWRYATPQELPELVQDCREDGCFEEERL